MLSARQAKTKSERARHLAIASRQCIRLRAKERAAKNSTTSLQRHCLQVLLLHPVAKIAERDVATCTAVCAGLPSSLRRLATNDSIVQDRTTGHLSSGVVRGCFAHRHATSSMSAMAGKVVKQ